MKLDLKLKHYVNRITNKPYKVQIFAIILNYIVVIVLGELICAFEVIL